MERQRLLAAVLAFAFAASGAAAREVEVINAATGYKLGGTKGANVRIFVDGQTFPELETEAVRAKQTADATVIVGVVVDDATSTPLANVRVTTTVGAHATTDARGVFSMIVPLRDSSTTVRFEKEGYGADVRENVDLWPYGDWIYRIRLRVGASETKHDDRPEEAVTAEAEEYGSAAGDVAITAAATVDGATYLLPTRIRVPNALGGVDYYSLDQYCKSVLPNEWYASWGNLTGGMDSLRAGAVACRTYALGFIREPAAAEFDICTSSGCQFFDPTRTHTNSNIAVDETSSSVLVNASQRITRGMAEYASENNHGQSSLCGDGYSGVSPNCIADLPCAGKARTGHGRGMCQWGSARWATGLWNPSQPTVGAHPYGRKNWQQILQHYYPDLTLASARAMAVGDTVSAVTSLPIRECLGGGIEGGVSCLQLFTKPAGATGRIIDGPRHVTADGRGHTWWRVEWSPSERGWAPENFLEGMTASMTAAARGDVDGDRVPDLVWRHRTTGANYLWAMHGASVASATLPAVTDTAWAIVATADVDADRRSDLLFRNTSTGANYLWLMNGAVVRSATPLPQVGTSWKVVGAGDLNGDGRDDFLWRDDATGSNYVWFMNGTTVTSAVLPSLDLSWKMVGAGDTDGDGRDDLFWRSGATTYVWVMNGATVTRAVNLAGAADASWSVAGVGDFNGDRKADVFWRRESDGQHYVWLVDNGTITDSRAMLTVPDTSWQPVAFGDFDGDGKCDVTWRHATTGQNYLWLLSGAAIKSSAGLPEVADPAWRIETP